MIKYSGINIILGYNHVHNTQATETVKLSQDWVKQERDGHKKYHRIIPTNTVQPVNVMTHSIEESENGDLSIQVFGKILNKTTTKALDILDTLPKNASLKQKVAIISRLNICKGNDDDDFLGLANRQGHFIDVKGQTIAKVQNGTIRHIKCAMLTNDVKCDACTRHRKSLMVKRSRRKKTIKGCIHYLLQF